MDAFSHQRRDGAVDDGMGRMSGKGQRMITVHAITNYGLVVAERVQMDSLHPRCVVIYPFHENLSLLCGVVLDDATKAPAAYSCYRPKGPDKTVQSGKHHTVFPFCGTTSLSSATCLLISLFPGTAKAQGTYQKMNTKGKAEICRKIRKSGRYTQFSIRRSHSRIKKQLRPFSCFLMIGGPHCIGYFIFVSFCDPPAFPFPSVCMCVCVFFVPVVPWFCCFHVLVVNLRVRPYGGGCPAFVGKSSTSGARINVYTAGADMVFG